jgi:hypothetical protein
MAEEKEQELNEAELSDVKNSIAALAKKYITGSFFDKLADSSGIKIAKDILLDDLKNLIGHGTSGLAAKKFANAIQMAKNPVAVDTILANYMLKGDGMGAGIGYSESEEVKPFKKFLSEAREEKKEVSQDLIAEARKIVEAEGFTVTDPEADKHVISKEKIEEAKKIVEARGYKVVNESDEEDTIFLEVPVEKLGFDLDEFESLVDMAMKDRRVPTFLRNKIELDSNGASDGSVQVIVYDAEDERDAKETLIKLIDVFLEDATGIEAEISEDLLDNYANLINKAEEV